MASEINNATKDIVVEVRELKQLLGASSLDIRGVAAQCKRTAVLLKGFREQSLAYNDSSDSNATGKIPESNINHAIDACREFILYAQNCCRQKSSDASTVEDHATKLTSAAREVSDVVNKNNPRYSRWAGAPAAPAAPAAASSYGAAAGGTGESEADIDDAFADVEEAARRSSINAEPVAVEVHQATVVSPPPPAPAAASSSGTDDLDALLDDMEAVTGSRDSSKEGQDLDDLLNSIDGGGGGGGATTASRQSDAMADELDALLNDL